MITSDESTSTEQLLAEIEALRSQITELQVVAAAKSLVEEALELEREQLVVTLFSIGDGVITTDTEGRVVLVNPVAQKLTGWSTAEASGKLIEEIFHIVNEHTSKIVENPVQKVLETGLIRGLANNTVLIARDGTTYVITDSAAPIFNAKSGQITGVVFVFRDITEQKQLEQELFKAQKLESIGVLAGGIAHDFNNILMAITSNVWLARIELGELSVAEDDKDKREKIHSMVEQLLTEAETAAYRAKDLTGQLLTFSKGGLPIKQTVNLISLLQETARFTLRGSNVSLQFNLVPDLWSVEADPNQISQVITNLVLNADQAMPGGGILTISAENISANDTTQQTQLLALPLKEIDYVKVTIQDMGVGISPQTLSRIFDPYFSTKQKGNGLGLATAFSIINRHEGFITALSQVDHGTTFLIYLPTSESHISGVDRSKRIESEQLVAVKPARLLIMDDEKAILTVLRKMLERVGYKVDMAEDGRKAVEMYREAQAVNLPYALVMVDLTVPGGIGGLETLVKLQEIDPQVKVIVSSGYNDNAIMAQYQEYGFVGMLAKPFSINRLYELLKKILNPDPTL